MHANDNEEPYWPPDPERLSPYWPSIRLVPVPANDDWRHVEDEFQQFVVRSAILDLMPVPNTFPDAPDLGSRVTSRPFSGVFRSIAAQEFDDAAYDVLLGKLHPALKPRLRPGPHFITLPSVYPAVYKTPGMRAANLP